MIKIKEISKKEFTYLYENNLLRYGWYRTVKQKSNRGKYYVADYDYKKLEGKTIV